MTILNDILKHIQVNHIIGSTDNPIAMLCLDSRKAVQDSLFIALKGLQIDGHQYIDKAISQGATTIVCESLPKSIQDDITYLETDNSHLCLAQIADAYYNHPSKQLKLVGITGTNGKTTLATLSYDLFTRAGYKVGLISTVAIKINGKTYPTQHTTPDAITINRFLKQMIDEGVTHCFMEVSSHGIHQHRTASLYFTGGVFTNLTHDHLDYHKDFAEYRNVKKQFFDNLPKQAFALTNIDDRNGAFMLQNTTAHQKTYALKTLADYKAKIIENSIHGLHLQIDNQDVWTKLIGTFNAYNLLGIYGIAIALGLDKMKVLEHLSSLESVAGRFQYFVSNNGITTIIDYAHTPDALSNVLNTIQDINNANCKIITVVGCGGDRDKTKRPKMAHIAASQSNTAIFTSDNPRTEDPQAIIDDMEAGVSTSDTNKTLSILDRKEAIKVANRLSNKGDIVLIAGKGHETYQDINGVKHDFDDYKIALQIFNQTK